MADSADTNAEAFADTENADNPTDTDAQGPAMGPDAEVSKWKALTRKHEERAKQNAAKVQQLEQAQQEITGRAETAEARASELETENIRLRLALTKGVPVDLLDLLKGDTEDEMAQAADKLLAHIAPPSPDRPRLPAPDPTQGANGTGEALNGDPLLRTLKDKLGIT
jgi:hypothetical protein